MKSLQSTPQKSERTILFTLLVFTVLVSLACSLSTRKPAAPPPTREPGPTFEPVTLPLVIEPTSLPNARTGAAYEVRLQVTQNVTPVGDMGIRQGALPAGLEFVFMDGEDAAVIRGAPEETGTFTFRLYAWCYGTQVSGQMLEKEYRLVVEQ